jgi:hypothetical protein
MEEALGLGARLCVPHKARETQLASRLKIAFEGSTFVTLAARGQPRVHFRSRNANCECTFDPIVLIHVVDVLPRS